MFQDDTLYKFIYLLT